MDQRNFVFSVLLTVVVVFMIAFSTVDAIQCYSCNSGKSYQGSKCEDVKNNEDLLFDCNTIAQNELRDYGIVRNYTMCRIFYQDVEGDTRVVRSCATHGQPQRGCIDRTGTKGIKLRYCECTEDKCNKSSALTAVLLMTSLAAIFAFVLGRRTV